METNLQGFRLVCERHKVDLRRNAADVQENVVGPALALDEGSGLWVWSLSHAYWECPTDAQIVEASAREVLSEAAWNAYVEDVGENKYGDGAICRDYWTVLNAWNYMHVNSNCTNEEECPYAEHQVV